MESHLTRRTVTFALVAGAVAPISVVAQTSEIWSAEMAADALQKDLIRMIDVRSRPEWADTGIAKGAWPISLHEDRFPERLFAARGLAEGRTVTLPAGELRASLAAIRIQHTTPPMHHCLCAIRAHRDGSPHSQEHRPQRSDPYPKARPNGPSSVGSAPYRPVRSLPTAHLTSCPIACHRDAADLRR